MTSALRTRGLTVTYGGVRALVDCDLDVEPGQIVGLIGPNGAGKTTFIDAVTGFTGSTGAVELDGRDITGLSPHQRMRAGFGRTWQAAELFDELTVRENLAVAAGRPRLRTTMRELWRTRPDSLPVVDETIELLGLQDLADALPESLTHGQRKIVGVGRALAGGCRVVLLDEPAAGLDTDESKHLGEQLLTVRDSGVSLLLVDHDMGLVLTVCDRLVVLDFGQVIASGRPDEVRRDLRVIEAYLGRAADEPSTEPSTGAVTDVVTS